MPKLMNWHAVGALIPICICASASAQVLQPPTNLRVDGIAATGCAGVLSGGNCYPTPPVVASAGRQWQLTYQEEFDGSGLNPSKLTPCPDWNYGACSGSFNAGREAYAASQVKVSGGTGKLIAAPAAAPVANSGCYLGVC